MTHSHTPGPWQVAYVKDAIAIVISDCLRITVDCREDFNANKADSNAHLIAAAPEMLEALQWLLKLNQDPDSRSTEWYMAWNRAQAVINKAEGHRE